ncbi:hypothetical protein PENSUB_2101 [Penicillium subrubescens]|uniref:Uncharacterized protein n=1 Tax=Penicillium subrubescens TaxID=1316194 RepID=A0A1Q5UIP1_9EURO|nr:hypothetical protein PENSUB_2101 [Penicillium subrubescens]
MEGWLGWLRSDPKSDEAFKNLERVENWLVVLRVVIIHSEDRTAAQTGLFGLLGDVRVQIVPVSEQARLSALFDLAERLDRQNQFAHRQNLERYSVEKYQEGLAHSVRYGLETNDEQTVSKFLKRMQPAVMFRLCTEMCNHSREEND